MVEKGEAVKKLEEELTCSVCLDHFANPKVLPCFHSFCVQCLQGIGPKAEPGSVEGGLFLACPKCRSPCALPDGGVTALPSSFVLNNLAEVYSLLTSAMDAKSTNCNKCGKEADSNRYCKQCAFFLCSGCLHQHDQWISDHQTVCLDEVASADHPPVLQARPSDCADHSKPQEIFCETCEQLVCQLCTIRKHAGHNFDVVADVYSKYKNVFASDINLLDRHIDRLKGESTNLIERGKEITNNSEEMKEKVCFAIAEIKERLDQTEKQLIQEVDLAFKHKSTIVDQQTKDAETVLHQLIECREHVQQSLMIGTPHQILSSKSQMFARMEGLVSKVKNMTFQPREEADIQVVLAEKHDIGEICENFATVKYGFHPTKVELVSPQSVQLTGSESTITIAFNLLDGSFASVRPSLINCRLSAPNNGSSKLRPIPCPVNESKLSGHYDVVLSPVSQGIHQLHVKVNSNEVSGSPLSIAVSVPLEKNVTLVKTIGGLSGPAGVALTDDGLIVVSEKSGHVISILNEKGKKVRSFGSFGKEKGELRFPCGIAISKNGTVVVADSHNHRIQEFSIEGKCLSCVGSKGKGPLEFCKPFSVAVDKTTGKVYVCDKGNNRLQVLNSNLNFSHSFGSEGSGQGQFKEPYDVTSDNRGFVYVADYGNDRVQKLTAKGQFVSSFGTQGSDLGQLTRPIGVAVHGNHVYISEDINNRRISVFTTHGEFVRSFGKGRPYRSTFDMNGHFYVCDDSENTIKIY